MTGATIDFLSGLFARVPRILKSRRYGILAYNATMKLQSLRPAIAYIQVSQKSR